MKLRIEHLTTLLMLLFILLGGCDGCNQELPPKVEPPAEKPAEKLTEQPQEVADVPIIENEPNEVEKPDPVVKRVPFPETYKPEDAHIWESIFVDAVDDPDYIQQLIPDDPERVIAAYINILNSGFSDERRVFGRVYATAVVKRFQNNRDVLYSSTTHLMPHYKSPREHKLAYVSVWERIKELNDELNTPIISEYRKTKYLSGVYCWLGDYVKALENQLEQNERFAEMRRQGVHHRGMYWGSEDLDIQWLRENAREQKAKEQEYSNLH